MSGGLTKNSNPLPGVDAHPSSLVVLVLFDGNKSGFKEKKQYLNFVSYR